MKAYHFSDKFLNILKPQYAQHSYTKKYSTKILYLYTTPKAKEFFIPSDYMYVVKVNKNNLLDLNKYIKDNIVLNVDEFLYKIKKSGYKGIIDKKRKVIYYFYNLKPEKIIKISRY